MAVKLSFHCQNKSFYSQYDFNGVHGGRRLGLSEPAFGGTPESGVQYKNTVVLLYHSTTGSNGFHRTIVRAIQYKLKACPPY